QNSTFRNGSIEDSFCPILLLKSSTCAENATRHTYVLAIHHDFRAARKFSIQRGIHRLDVRHLLYVRGSRPKSRTLRLSRRCPNMVPSGSGTGSADSSTVSTIRDSSSFTSRPRASNSEDVISPSRMSFSEKRVIGSRVAAWSLSSFGR